MALQQKRYVLEHLYNHVTQDSAELLKLSGMPARTFYRNYAKLERGKCLKRLQGSGRPKKLSSNNQRRVVQLARKNPVWSSQKLACTLQDKAAVSVTDRTVRRYLRRAGYVKLLPKKIPALTDKHKLQRIEFCQKNLQLDISNVFITDESLFQLHRNTLRLWSKTNCRSMKAVPKFSPSVMVWGALSTKGFYLKILPSGSINSEKYCATVKEFLPFANNLFPNGWILQQDGATAHTARGTKAWFERNNVTVLQWPPNSPDLSPVENVWQILKDEVEKVSPSSVVELRHEIEQSVRKVTQPLQVKLMESMRKRFQVCLEQKGGLVK